MRFPFAAVAMVIGVIAACACDSGGIDDGMERVTLGDTGVSFEVPPEAPEPYKLGSDRVRLYCFDVKLQCAEGTWLGVHVLPPGADLRLFQLEGQDLGASLAAFKRQYENPAVAEILKATVDEGGGRTILETHVVLFEEELKSLMVIELEDGRFVVFLRNSDATGADRVLEDFAMMRETFRDDG